MTGVLVVSVTVLAAPFVVPFVAGLTAVVLFAGRDVLAVVGAVVVTFDEVVVAEVVVEVSTTGVTAVVGSGIGLLATLLI